MMTISKIDQLILNICKGETRYLQEEHQVICLVVGKIMLRYELSIEISADFELPTFLVTVEFPFSKRLFVQYSHTGQVNHKASPASSLSDSTSSPK